MQLQRVDEGKIIAGVATGLAQASGIDVTWVRVGLVLFTVFGGSGLLLYGILWAVIPRAGGGTVAEDAVRNAKRWADEHRPDEHR